jgi:hypothetical protein
MKYLSLLALFALVSTAAAASANDRAWEQWNRARGFPSNNRDASYSAAQYYAANNQAYHQMVAQQQYYYPQGIRPDHQHSQWRAVKAHATPAQQQRLENSIRAEPVRRATQNDNGKNPQWKPTYQKQYGADAYQGRIANKKAVKKGLFKLFG